MMVATFSRRIEGAAYVSSKADIQVSRISIICDNQAEGKLFMGVAYRFHALKINAAVLFKSQRELLSGVGGRLKPGLDYFDSIV